jgi:hypothetical protein
MTNPIRSQLPSGRLILQKCTFFHSISQLSPNTCFYLFFLSTNNKIIVIVVVTTTILLLLLLLFIFGSTKKKKWYLPTPSFQLTCGRVSITLRLKIFRCYVLVPTNYEFSSILFLCHPPQERISIKKCNSNDGCYVLAWFECIS